MVRFKAGESAKRRRGQLTWFLAWVAVTIAALVLSPSPEGHGTHRQLGLPPCPSVAFFDRPCLGCGMTTSFTAFVHGDFGASFRAHPFGPVMYLAFSATALLAIWAYGRKLVLDTDTLAFHRASIALLLLFVAFGSYRFATTRYGSAEFQLSTLGSSLGGEQGR
jgi:hypothetical protein